MNKTKPTPRPKRARKRGIPAETTINVKCHRDERDKWKKAAAEAGHASLSDAVRNYLEYLTRTVKRNKKKGVEF